MKALSSFKSETPSWQKRRSSPRNAAKRIYRLEALFTSVRRYVAAAAGLLISPSIRVSGI